MAKRRAPYTATQGSKAPPTEAPSGAPKTRGREGVVLSRLDYIAGLMRSLKFKRGTTVRTLAARWDLSEERVRELTAEASALVRAEVCDPDAVQADVSVALMRVMNQAYRLGEWKTTVAAAKVWAQVTGATAPKRISIKQEPTEKLTDAELEALVADAIAVLESRKKAA